MPPTMSETKRKIQRLVADCAFLPHLAVVAVEDNCQPGQFQAYVISRNCTTAGALLTPSDWEDPPGGRHRYLSVPADTAGWRMTDILHQAGITEIIYRDEPAEAGLP